MLQILLNKLTKLICSRLVTLVFASFDEPTTTASAWALDNATFILFFEKRKSIPLGLSEASDEHIEMMTTGASCP